MLLLLQSTDTLDECATRPQSVLDAIQSPVPLNYNNNHVENLPVHTYATDKLPSIIEMLSTRNKNSAPVSYTSQAMPNGVENHKETSQIKTDSNIERIEPSESAEEEELGMNDQHPDESIISETSEIQENGTNHLILNNETLINRFGDKNPNLSLKGESNDIMNMDIIFENVPIEEDTSVLVETQTIPMTHSSVLVGTQTIPITHSPTIDGVQYEIITLNEDQTPTINNETNVIDMDEISAETATQTKTVTATEMAIGTDTSCGVYASNEVVVVDQSQSVEMAAQIEIGNNNNRSDEEEPVNGDYEITQPIDYSNAKHHSQPIIIDDKKFELPIEQSDPKKCPCEQNTKKEETLNETKGEGGQEMRDAEQKPITISILDRKRKRKPVPVLNKRPRRTNLVKPPEPKVQNERADADPNAEPLKIEQFKEPVASEILEYTSPADVNVETKQEEASNENGISNSIEQNGAVSIDAEACEQNEKNNNSDADQPDEPEPVDQDDGDSDENSSMNSLVVVESQDPNDLSKTLYEVFVVDPVTKQMSEKPLDLPDDVIQRIRMSM